MKFWLSCSIQRSFIFIFRTYFEDLSNELWYEIFDFLDQYYLYQTLANLNTRLHHLIIHSSLHLKINLSNISKSMFNQRCKYILAPNIQRIVALSISNNMPIDHFLNMLPLKRGSARGPPYSYRSAPPKKFFFSILLPQMKDFD